jgi:hypothetical protein
LAKSCLSPYFFFFCFVRCTPTPMRFLRESVKVSVLHGPEKFVMAMLQELNSDRRDQRGIREKERLGLEWPKIIGAIATVWKWREPWDVISVQLGKGALGLAYYPLD